MAPFTISEDPARCLLEVALRGHWDTAMIADYKVAVVAAGGRLLASGCTLDAMRVRVDLRDYGVQSQDTVNAYLAKFADPRFQAGRLAIVVGSALLKLQMRRMDLPGQQLFGDPGQALAWLMAPGDGDAG